MASSPFRSRPKRQRFNKDDRSDFRVLAKGFEFLDGEEWCKSRKALVAYIRKTLDNKARDRNTVTHGYPVRTSQKYARAFSALGSRAPAEHLIFCCTKIHYSGMILSLVKALS